MKTLLHTCCGPCASACVPRLKELDREVTMIFANSNIDTREEFEKRLQEAERLAKVEGVKLVALAYEHEEWLREVAAGYEHEPEKGARCARCFRYNLAKVAAYAAEHGYDEFTTSLTVSPHKDSKTIFTVAESIPPSTFLPVDFKKREGFKLSVRRAKELGLYRQGYCGCEFSRWRIHHQVETVSTNLDAHGGCHGDVYTADFQTAGRGRLDHRWISPPQANLLMSVVLSVAGLEPEAVLTLPLAMGLAVIRGLTSLLQGLSPAIALQLKWPNDVLLGGKKIAGILCERDGDKVIVGIGINVKSQNFPQEIADKATSLGVCPQFSGSVPNVRDAVLRAIGQIYDQWLRRGFAAIFKELKAVDFLWGQTLSVRQTDNDPKPVCGLSRGINPDGTLDVGGAKIYAGEAHITKINKIR